MARRGSFTSERLQEIGRISAEKEKTGLDQSSRARLECLSCVYRGVVTSSGEDVSTARIKADSQVTFEWRLRGEGFDEGRCVQMLC